MKNLWLASLLFLATPAQAATFQQVQEALIGWHYTYEAISNGHQVPIYFALRQCNHGPTAVMAQGQSPLAQSFPDEAAARIEAQKWADKEELRYRDVQNPSLWAKLKRMVGQ